MWPSNWLRIQDEPVDLVAQCRGLRGQAWAYSVSHSQLLIRFYQEGDRAGIYLYCKMCDLVHFQADWENADLSVHISEGQNGRVYAITDGDRLRIVCGAAFVAHSSNFIRFE